MLGNVKSEGRTEVSGAGDELPFLRKKTAKNVVKRVGPHDRELGKEYPIHPFR